MGRERGRRVLQPITTAGRVVKGHLGHPAMRKPLGILGFCTSSSFHHTIPPGYPQVVQRPTAMALKMHHVQVWSGDIPDRPGAAAGTLELLARSGADLEFVFTR